MIPWCVFFFFLVWILSLLAWHTHELPRLFYWREVLCSDRFVTGEIKPKERHWYSSSVGRGCFSPVHIPQNYMPCDKSLLALRQNSSLAFLVISLSLMAYNIRDMKTHACYLLKRDWKREWDIMACLYFFGIYIRDNHANKLADLSGWFLI